MIYTDFRCSENLALFLPFSCNQSLQLGACLCKADDRQPIEDTS